MQVTLASEIDVAGFRREARRLLAAGAPPEAVHWSVEAGVRDLLADLDIADGAPSTPAPSVAVPKAFVDLCETVALHSEPQRFALLYRLLWRLAHEASLRHDPLDPDMLLAQRMAKAVRHDIHKMRAFVRFREVPDESAPEGVAHVAWFEPEHHIVEANAPWFMRRFTQMRWAILTPRRCVAWDGQSLVYRPGASRADAPPADAGEALWLTYYQSIFNPARLKLAMMRKEMPRKYWHNLPEARFISPLAAAAQARSGAMLEEAPTHPDRRVVLIERAPAPHAAAGSPEALALAVDRCRQCPIGAMATQGVSGEGPVAARVMLVGEQPGDQEDLGGRPFIGPAGKLLDRALAELGVDRGSLYLTNAVRHFKFELRGKRRIHKTPTQQEAAACLHWLEEEIGLVRPGAIVALGATAARSLLQRPVAVTAERGQWHARADGLRVLVTLHPSALLRMDPAQREAGYAQWLADLALALGDARVGA